MAKEKNLYDDVLNSIDKIDPYATYLSDHSLSSVDDWIDTGSYVLNSIISGSTKLGIPKGRLTQFLGESQTFKTGFMMQIIANAQKQGMRILLFDVENAYTPEGAARFGIDPTRVKVSDSTTIEKIRNIINTFLENVREHPELRGKYLIVMDSIANMQSELELKRMAKDSTSSDMGTYAKSIKSLLKVCTNMAAATNTPIIFTNHVYDDPSQMFPSLAKDFPGGKSAKFLPSVNVQLARKLVKNDDVKTADTQLAASQKSYSGIVIRALIVKNRFVQPFLEADMYLSFSSGMHKYYGLLEVMRSLGVVSNSGPTYSDWEGNKLGFAKSFRNDTDLWENRLLPEYEKQIQLQWQFGNLKEGEVEEFPDEGVEDLEDITPLEKLKEMKKKVSDKLDETEAD